MVKCGGVLEGKGSVEVYWRGREVGRCTGGEGKCRGVLEGKGSVGVMQITLVCAFQ